MSLGTWHPYISEPWTKSCSFQKLCNRSRKSKEDGNKFYDKFHIMSQQQKIIQPGKEAAWSKREFCKNMYAMQMVGTVFSFAVSSLTRTRGPNLMQVLKYSVLIVTFFPRYELGKTNKKEISVLQRVDISCHHLRWLKIQ